MQMIFQRLIWIFCVCSLSLVPYIVGYSQLIGSYMAANAEKFVTEEQENWNSRDMALKINAKNVVDRTFK